MSNATMTAAARELLAKQAEADRPAQPVKLERRPAPCPSCDGKGYVWRRNAANCNEVKDCPLCFPNGRDLTPSSEPRPARPGFHYITRS